MLFQVDISGYNDPFLNLINRKVPTSQPTRNLHINDEKFRFFHLVKQFLPVVLSHEPEERQKSPSKGIETGVAVVWIPSHFQAVESIWTLPARAQVGGPCFWDTNDRNKGFCAHKTLRQLGQRWQAPRVKVSTCGSATFDSDVKRSRWVSTNTVTNCVMKSPLEICSRPEL